MKIKQQTDLIVEIQIYHRPLVRALLILAQENNHYGSYLFMQKSDYFRNITKLLCDLIRKVKILMVHQKKKTVNPHSQSCAYNSRFRPSKILRHLP